MYAIKRNDSPTVNIIGSIDNYQRGESVKVILTKPNGETETMSFLPTKDGVVRGYYSLHYYSELGTYSISASYIGQNIGSVSFDVEEYIPEPEIVEPDEQFFGEQHSLTNIHKSSPYFEITTNQGKRYAFLFIDDSYARPSIDTDKALFKSKFSNRHFVITDSDFNVLRNFDRYSELSYLMHTAFNTDIETTRENGELFTETSFLASTGEVFRAISNIASSAAGHVTSVAVTGGTSVGTKAFELFATHLCSHSPLTPL